MLVVHFFARLLIGVQIGDDKREQTIVKLYCASPLTCLSSLAASTCSAATWRRRRGGRAASVLRGGGRRESRAVDDILPSPVHPEVSEGHRVPVLQTYCLQIAFLGNFQ